MNPSPYHGHPHKDVPPEERPATPTEKPLSTKTPIRIDLVIIIIGVVMSYAGLFWKLNAIESKMRNAWTVQEQVYWSQQMARDNAGLKMPDTYDVIQKVNQ